MSTAPTFKDYATTILARRVREGIRGHYHEQNRFSVHIEPAPFASLPLADIRPRDLRAWLREMAEKGARRTDHKLSADTIKRSMSLVSSVFTAAVEDELIETSPASDVRVKKRADESSTVEKWAFLTIEEQRLIRTCKAIPYCDRLTIRFAIGTGLRQGEQFSLRLTDLHVGHDEPHVVVRFGRPNLPPKSGKIRRVPLFGDALTAAKLWLYELPQYTSENPYALVFPARSGRHRSCGKPLGSGGELKEYLARVGVTRRVTWHSLRHTAATNLVTGVLGRRWTLEEIRPFMGHSNVATTERYAHVGDDALKRAARETAPTPIEIASPPIANAVPVPADTAPDLETWFDKAAAS